MGTATVTLELRMISQIVSYVTAVDIVRVYGRFMVCYCWCIILKSLCAIKPYFTQILYNKSSLYLLTMSSRVQKYNIISIIVTAAVVVVLVTGGT